MPTKPCKECGEQVSDRAKACPKCGAPTPLGALDALGGGAMGIGCILTLLFTLPIVMLLAC